MDLKDVIRRHMPELAFGLLLSAALLSGGDAALHGMPRFVDAILPGMAAQADVDDGLAHGVARLPVPQGFGESRFAPQVLYPVIQNPMPDWLMQAIRQANGPTPPALRGATNDKTIGRPVIAICIDDLGEDLAATDRAMTLPREVALSFLPYAETTPFLAEAAARRGHLVLAHVPMQAVGGENPGPMALQSGMSAVEIARRLGWDLSRVPGLVGINNHEGSRFTANSAAMGPVMATLKTRHLFFFDSRTGPDSQAETVARAAGVMTAGRDVFLDDDQNPTAIEGELELLVRLAKHTGVAIAIGHPHDITLKILAAWLAKDHGVTLVPLDEAMRRKSEGVVALARN